MEPWAVLSAVVGFYLLLILRDLRNFGRRFRRGFRRRFFHRPRLRVSRSATTRSARHAVAPPPGRTFGSDRGRQTISGRARVTDGDGILVSGQEIRFVGLDAPEWDQVAKDREGRWFNHGGRVKRALAQRVGGRSVHVKIEGYDDYGRALGIVTCNGQDVGEWLVREGHAIAAYSDRYKHVEQEARRARRGMWDHEANIDPRAWRHRTSGRN